MMAQKSAESSAKSGEHEQYATHTPKTYAHAGERWTREEKTTLARLIRSGLSVEEIANQLQRSPGAVRSRMEEKGLLATQEPDVQLEAEFHHAMLDVYEVAAKHKYYAIRFKQLVGNRGGVEAARLLLAREEVTTGLLELQKLDLLEHSAEATVLQERFRALFTEAELQKARRRLESLGFVPE
jgi:hypothetical protein